MKPDTLALTPVRSRFSDLFVLTKVRLNSLVVATAAGGYYMAAPADVDPVALGVACLGTALVAGGAAALNQVSERDLDRLMERTRQRPLPDGRMSAGEGVTIGAGMAALGLAILWLGANALAALVALATLVTYIVFYTPLKRRTSLATVVGAIPGALPPLIGWAAARGTLDVAACSLFLIMFVWQLPHFLAIAWMYRDDYARAGLPLLAVVDTTGRMTGLQATLWAATLLPVALLPALVHISGLLYAAGALVLGTGLLVLAVRFGRRRSREKARDLFLGSLVYLPMLWILMGIGRL
jgi:heme o synthase